MIGLYIAFPASAVSSSSLLPHDWLIYLQLGSFHLLQTKKLAKIVDVGGTNLSSIRYYSLWDRQGQPLLPPVWICSILHREETPYTLTL